MVKNKEIEQVWLLGYLTAIFSIVLMVFYVVLYSPYWLQNSALLSSILMTSPLILYLLLLLLLFFNRKK